MSLSFLSKKSWHTATLQNAEKAWVAEQQKAEEEKKLRELKQQIAEERELEELQALQPGKAKATKLEWMYQGPKAQQPSTEEYLQGKEFSGLDDKSDVAKLEEPKKEVPGSLWLEQASSNRNENFAKIHGDPLLAIKRKQLEARKKVLQNPITMAQVRQRALAMAMKEKEGGKKSKRDRDLKRDRKKAKKSSRKKYKRHRSSSHSPSRRALSDSGIDDSKQSDNPRIRRNRHRSNSPTQRGARGSGKQRRGDRNRSRSPKEHRSRSPREHRSRSPRELRRDRNRSRSPKEHRRDRNRSRSPKEHRRNRNRSRSPKELRRNRNRSRSPKEHRRDRNRSGSPKHHRRDRNLRRDSRDRQNSSSDQYQKPGHSAGSMDRGSMQGSQSRMDRSRSNRYRDRPSSDGTRFGSTSKNVSTNKESSRKDSIGDEQRQEEQITSGRAMSETGSAVTKAESSMYGLQGGKRTNLVGNLGPSQEILDARADYVRDKLQQDSEVNHPRKVKARSSRTLTVEEREARLEAMRKDAEWAEQKKKRELQQDIMGEQQQNSTSNESKMTGPGFLADIRSEVGERSIAESIRSSAKRR